MVVVHLACSIMETIRKQTMNTQTTEAISNFLFMSSRFQQTKQFLLLLVNSHSDILTGTTEILQPLLFI